MGLRGTVRGSRGSKQVPWVLQPGVMSSAGPCGSNIEGFLRFLWWYRLSVGFTGLKVLLRAHD